MNPSGTAEASPAARDLFAIALTLAAACSRGAVVVHEDDRAAPVADEQGACFDVGERRVCWNPSPRVVSARPVPLGPEPELGWRCDGRGSARRCIERRANAGAFTCDDRTCVQERPRMPDDGEWECVDDHGVVVCRGGAPAAGVVPGPADRGWTCKPWHRGRICVDLDPDRPGPGAWACKLDYRSGEARTCVRGGGPTVGGACASDAVCPTGAVCVGSICVPRVAPSPACWLDADCGGGSACHFGTCAR